MIRATARDYRLAAGSAVLRVSYWQCTTRRDLMSLIKRFATRENQSRQHGAPTFRWRRRRLGAIGVFERRFEKVPEVFRNHKLPKNEVLLRSSKKVHLAGKRRAGKAVILVALGKTGSPILMPIILTTERYPAFVTDGFGSK